MKHHPSSFNSDLHFNRLAEYTEKMAADLKKICKACTLMNL